jgi:cell division protein FtsN
VDEDLKGGELAGQEREQNFSFRKPESRRYGERQEALKEDEKEKRKKPTQRIEDDQNSRLGNTEKRRTTSSSIHYFLKCPSLSVFLTYD